MTAVVGADTEVSTAEPEVDGQPSTSTRRERFLTVSRFMAMTATFTALWLMLFSLLPTLIGWDAMVVSSGSMGPVLSAGDVIHIDGDYPAETLGSGSIVTFDGPRDMPITHRIVAVDRTADGSVAFQTKGDANLVADSAVVAAAEVNGVARLVVPFAGLPSYWAGTGQWFKLIPFLILMFLAAAITIDTIAFYVAGWVLWSGGLIRGVAVLSIAMALTMSLPSTSAAFVSTSDGSGSFEMTTTWLVDAIDQDSPVAHWRLGEPPSGASTVVYTDDFESFGGYTDFGSGTFVGSTAQARSGSASGLKTSNNDPNGGWRSLGTPVTGSFIVDVWVYRPSGFGGGSIDRLGLEDGSFNGYSANVDHNGNSMRIDRRTGGSASAIGSSVAFNAPEDAWYRLELARNGSSITLTAYDGGGAVLATTSAVDGTTTSFDRFVVRGGWDYYIDDLTVTQTSTVGTAVDRIATLDGQYQGGVVTGVVDVATGDGDTAAAFDGVDDIVLIGDSALINTTTRPERTVELWFEANSLTGRQVLYEEGGGTNGINIYLDGGVLYGTAWSNSTGWSNSLIVSTGVTAGTRYHVGISLDAVTARSLEMYVDGVSVGSATKTDAAQWNAHTDDGAIGALNSGTRFHDGTAGGGGFHFDGNIDEVVLYNTALPADRILNHANAGR